MRLIYTKIEYFIWLILASLLVISLYISISVNSDVEDCKRFLNNNKFIICETKDELFYVNLQDNWKIVGDYVCKKDNEISLRSCKIIKKED